MRLTRIVNLILPRPLGGRGTVRAADVHPRRVPQACGMSLLRLLPASVAVAAILAVPAAASAAQTLGSPLDPSRGQVDAVGCPNPCTIAQETIDGLPVHADGGVITSWKADTVAFRAQF